ncbi:MAG: homoserine dehydrogenase [Pseudomonadota bacterium]
MTTPYRLGIAGLGTVGSGVIQLLFDEADSIAAKAGRPVVISAVSARSRSRERPVDISGFGWEDDPVALAARDDVDCVIEVIGGSDGPAKATVERAIAGGRDVVTANKALIAHHGQALGEAAETAGTGLAAEAAVAGGIPALRALGEGLAGNRITRVFGVLNGTCNFILSEMASRGAAYDDVLAEAQKLGYAEADPSFDVGGIDAAHKLAILASLAFGTRVDIDAVVAEGIERVSPEDIATARDMGLVIRLLGLAQMTDTGLEQRVRPVMVQADTVIGALPGVTNAVVIEGEAIGQVTLTGPGAGAGPTASAIMADVVALARGHRAPLFGRPSAGLIAATPLPHGDEHAPYYLRVQLADAPGMLAQLATALGQEGISIQRMHQYDGPPDASAVPVVLITHDAPRAAVDAAIARIADGGFCEGTPVAMRLETV